MEEELSPEQKSPAEECQPLKYLSADSAASCAVVHAAAAGAECEASPASPTAAREQPVTAREQRAKTPGRRPDRRSDLALGSHRSRVIPRELVGSSLVTAAGYPDGSPSNALTVRSARSMCTKNVRSSHQTCTCKKSRSDVSSEKNILTEKSTSQSYYLRGRNCLKPMTEKWPRRT